MSTTTEPCPDYDEKLYATAKRQYDEKGRPRRHGRWRASSNVPRYSKQQEQWIGRYFREEDGWHRGARVTRA